MRDPTKSEMIEALTEHFGSCIDLVADEFDIEEAIYWFASDYHGGQWSNLYSVLSTSAYRPGPTMSGPDHESLSAMIYEALVSEFN